jgi:hypothetical protein
MTQRPMLALGSVGPEVVTLQSCLAVPADGIFGNQTDGAVRKYQAENGLTVDGIVGQDTWAALEEEFDLPPYEAPEAPLSELEVRRICDLAAKSQVASYVWRNRGAAPIGYTKGVAVSYAAAVRRWQARHPSFLEMAKANTHDPAKDALAYYASTFNQKAMPNEVAGLDTLRHVYVFVMGLGMRESSGKHCCGRDQSAENVQSETCEAGAWQTSANAMNCKKTLTNTLFDEYAAGAEGYVNVYKEKVSCSSSDWANYGTGKGLAFQNMSKRQPRFAIEMAAIVIRNLRQHYGPINRREVEVRNEADVLFKDVENALAPVALPPVQPPVMTGAPNVSINIDPPGSVRVRVSSS